MVGLLIAAIWVAISVLMGTSAEGYALFVGPANFLIYWYLIWGSIGTLAMFGLSASVMEYQTGRWVFATFVGSITALGCSLYVFAAWLMLNAAQNVDEHSLIKMLIGLGMIVIGRAMNRGSSNTYEKQRERSSYRSPTFRSNRRRTLTPKVTVTTSGRVIHEPKKPVLAPKPPPLPKPPPVPEGTPCTCEYCNSTQYVLLPKVSTTISCTSCGAPIPVKVFAA